MPMLSLHIVLNFQDSKSVQSKGMTGDDSSAQEVHHHSSHTT